MEAFPREDPAQVRMPGERDPEHVPRLPLGPVRREEHLGDRGDFLPVADAALDADPVVFRERIEVVHDVEAGLAIAPVDRGHVDAVAEVLDVLQMPGDGGDLFSRDDDGDLPRELLRGDDGAGNARAERLDPGVRGGVRRLDLFRRGRLRSGGGRRRRCRGRGLSGRVRRRGDGRGRFLGHA